MCFDSTLFCKLNIRTWRYVTCSLVEEQHMSITVNSQGPLYIWVETREFQKILNKSRETLWGADINILKKNKDK